MLGFKLQIKPLTNLHHLFSSPVPLKFLDIAHPAQLPQFNGPMTYPPLKVQLEPSHVDLPPESSPKVSPVAKPKYLELIYHPDDDVQDVPTTISQRSIQSPGVITSNHNINNNSGYEIPITDLILKATAKMNENNFNRNMECVIVGDCKTVL